MIHYTHRFSIKVTARNDKNAASEWRLWDAQDKKFSEHAHATIEEAKAQFMQVMDHFSKLAGARIANAACAPQEGLSKDMTDLRAKIAKNTRKAEKKAAKKARKLLAREDDAEFDAVEREHRNFNAQPSTADLYMRVG